MYNNVRLVLL